MTRILSVLLWAAVFLLIAVAIDQLLVRVPARLPAHVAVADFYRDLRIRVVDLLRGEAPPPASPKTVLPAKARQEARKSIEEVIAERPAKSTVPGKPAEQGATPRYIYADKRGELHFAGTLAEVPEEYRGQAKRLGD